MITQQMQRTSTGINARLEEINDTIASKAPFPDRLLPNYKELLAERAALETEYRQALEQEGAAAAEAREIDRRVDEERRRREREAREQRVNRAVEELLR